MSQESILKYLSENVDREVTYKELMNNLNIARGTIINQVLVLRKRKEIIMKYGKNNKALIQLNSKNS